MDVTTLRKAYSGFAPNPVRPASPAVRDAVRTEVPAKESVTPSDSMDASNDAGAEARKLVEVAEAMRKVIDRRNVVDPRSREMVFQAVNAATGDVVRQTPSEITLQLRAYVRAEDDATIGSGKVA